MPDTPTEEKGCKDCTHHLITHGRELIFCTLKRKHIGYKYAFTASCPDYKLKESN